METDMNIIPGCSIMEAVLSGARIVFTILQGEHRRGRLFLWGYNWKETLKVCGFVKKSG